MIFPSKWHRSISARLTIWYGVSFLILSGLMVGILVTSFLANQHALLQHRLFSEQNKLIVEVMGEAEAPAFVPALSQRTGAYRVADPFGMYVRLLSPEGKVLDQSANFSGRVAFDPVLPSSRTDMTIRDLTWENQWLRSMYVPLHDEDETLKGWLEVSGYEWDLSHPMLELRWPFILSIVFTMILASLGGYGLARRALKPVALLTKAANEIKATDLSVRLPVNTPVQDELTELAKTFNSMLARLEASFDLDRRFTANAAHELLNPLTNLRNKAEVARRRPRNVAAYQRILDTMLLDILRMGSLVEGLLQLSRAEALDGSCQERFDLSTLCVARVARIQSKAEKQNIDLQHYIKPQVFISAHAAHLETVLDNLLENALKYTHQGGTITVKLSTGTHLVRLAISDTGIGFSDAERDQLFNRFFRSGAPEVQAQQGCGLGLALVRTLVETYGGIVSGYSKGKSQGSTFEVSFPLSLS